MAQETGQADRITLSPSEFQMTSAQGLLQDYEAGRLEVGYPDLIELIVGALGANLAASSKQ